MDFSADFIYDLVHFMVVEESRTRFTRAFPLMLLLDHERTNVACDDFFRMEYTSQLAINSTAIICDFYKLQTLEMELDTNTDWTYLLFFKRTAIRLGLDKLYSHMLKKCYLISHMQSRSRRESGYEATSMHMMLLRCDIISDITEALYACIPETIDCILNYINNDSVDMHNLLTASLNDLDSFYMWCRSLKSPKLYIKSWAIVSEKILGIIKGLEIKIFQAGLIKFGKDREVALYCTEKLKTHFRTRPVNCVHPLDIIDVVIKPLIWNKEGEKRIPCPGVFIAIMDNQLKEFLEVLSYHLGKYEQLKTIPVLDPYSEKKTFYKCTAKHPFQIYMESHVLIGWIGDYSLSRMFYIFDKEVYSVVQPHSLVPVAEREEKFKTFFDIADKFFDPENINFQLRWKRYSMQYHPESIVRWMKSIRRLMKERIQQMFGFAGLGEIQNYYESRAFFAELR